MEYEVSILSPLDGDMLGAPDGRLSDGFLFIPVTVGAKPLILPVKTFVNTEVVPNGDSGSGKYSTRHTLFTAEYKDYQPAAH